MRNLVVDDNIGYDDDGDNFDEYARDPYSRSRDPYVTIFSLAKYATANEAQE